MNKQSDQLNKHFSKQIFGFLKNGTRVYSYTISNKNGMKLTVSDWGATITSLLVPINDSEKIDVVLGFDSAEDYEQSFINKNAPFFGAVVGLIAGRIKNGKIILNGNHIQLDTNFGNHHLHGGFQNLSNQLWRLKESTTGENPSLSFEIITEKNNGNYPASVTVTAKYQILENNSLKITLSATASDDTPINLTQHNYFNLNGHQHCIENLLLKLTAKQYLETDADLIPTGKKLSVTDSPFDYTNFKPCPQSIDTSFVLDQQEAAILFNTENNLCMHVSTNQPSAHIYVGGLCDDDLKCKNGVKYHRTSGICFETQNFPDAPNRPEFPDAILRKGETYFNETVFKFSKNPY